MFKVIPLLASDAFHHVLVLSAQAPIALTAVAVHVLEVCIVAIAVILEVSLLIVKQTGKGGHAPIPAVTSEVRLAVELKHMMVLVALETAPEAKPMWSKLFRGLK